MAPRALVRSFPRSLLGTTDNAETSQRVLELLIEHWPWLSSGLHHVSRSVSVGNAPQSFAEASLYTYRWNASDFVDRLIPAKEVFDDPVLSSEIKPFPHLLAVVAFQAFYRMSSQALAFSLVLLPFSFAEKTKENTKDYSRYCL
ncbi:unnamed protein product [Dibothriocephalus latus]|uniref:Uncharacterized protein n=1 Tax=Dibothriocephalus latus TaxID=60516 RepID=A0A3P7NS99_DIBLA|nr:unnamed protein product [Dibothriocephalus latus]